MDPNLIHFCAVPRTTLSCRFVSSCNCLQKKAIPALRRQDNFPQAWAVST